MTNLQMPNHNNLKIRFRIFLKWSHSILSPIVLILQILYFSSLAPEAFLKIVKYLPILENIPQIEILQQHLEHRFSNTKNYFFGYSDNEISAFENSRNPRSGLDSEY